MKPLKPGLSHAHHALHASRFIPVSSQSKLDVAVCPTQRFLNPSQEESNGVSMCPQIAEGHYTISC